MKRSVAELKALVADAEARCARPAQPSAVLADIRQVVAEEVARVCPWRTPDAEYVREEHRLRADLGFDDLDRIGLALGLEERLDLHVKLDSFEWGRVVDVVRAVARAAGGRCDDVAKAKGTGR
jgi:acyl carrier protein